MTSDSAFTVPSPTEKSVSSILQATDYHSHPNIPNWVLDINKRLEANESKLLQYSRILAENLELKESLISAKTIIAKLTRKLAGVTVSSLEKPDPVNAETQTTASVPAKSVSFSEIVTSSSATSSAKAVFSSRPSYFVSKKAAVRSFLPVSESQGFQYLYLFCRGREPYSVTRSKLRKLGIASNRILDIHYPAKQVLALLVPNDYAPSATDIFQKSDIKLKTDFNPLSPSTIQDTLHSSLSTKEKTTKATELHQKRLCNAVKRIMSPTTRSALAKAFHKQKWITDSLYHSLALELNLPPLKPQHSSMEE